MLQNRVNPWGALCAVSDRGQLMGNRGILHNEHNNIVRAWKHKAWVTCLLQFKDIQRPKPFSQGNYSELFFLDEVTAFAAGHRPCNFCQRARAQEFKEAWVRANIPAAEQQAVTMPDVDKVLHAERAIRGGGKKTYPCRLSELPRGAMFDLGGVAYAVGLDGVHHWSFSGYGPAVAMDSNATVEVLTPASVVRTFSAGFVPKAHESLKLS
jgi:hypothetical protein